MTAFILDQLQGILIIAIAYALGIFLAAATFVLEPWFETLIRRKFPNNRHGHKKMQKP